MQTAVRIVGKSGTVSRDSGACAVRGQFVCGREIAHFVPTRANQCSMIASQPYNESQTRCAHNTELLACKLLIPPAESRSIASNPQRAAALVLPLLALVLTVVLHAG